MPFSSHTRLLRLLVQVSSYSRTPTPLLPQCSLPGILTPNREQQDVSRVLSAFLTCLPPVARPAGFHVGWFVFWPIVCTRLDAPRPRGWAQFPFGCLTLVLRDTRALSLPHRNLKHGGKAIMWGSWPPSAVCQMSTPCNFHNLSPQLNWGCSYRRCLCGQLLVTSQ